jgi:hypothetical protein
MCNSQGERGSKILAHSGYRERREREAGEREKREPAPKERLGYCLSM